MGHHGNIYDTCLATLTVAVFFIYLKFQEQFPALNGKTYCRFIKLGNSQMKLFDFQHLPQNIYEY